MQFKQYINGAWCDAQNAGTLNVIDPANGEYVQTVPYGDGNDTTIAIDAAHDAFRTWKKMSPWTRADILQKTANYIRQHIVEFATLMVRESGKPLAEAKGEWTVAANLFEWYAEEGKRAYGTVIPSARTDKRMQVILQPMGVIGVITAWNFPAYNPARAWAAALAAGCTIVAKVSEFTPLSGMLLINALEASGIPKGVVNLVNGDAANTGKILLQDARVRKISFTGSTRVGKILMSGAAETNTKLALELGGNAPVIIMPDVDIDHVAKTAVAGRFRNCGQVCIAPQRFFVHADIIDAFQERVVYYTAQLNVGHGLEPETRIGPLINSIQQDHVLSIITEAKAEGNEVLTGGHSIAGGHFVAPTVIRVKNVASVFYDREIFGPVMPLIPFNDIDEVIKSANETPYGLAAYVWTNNINHATYISEALEFGIVGINEWAAHATEAPFGGWKQSGLGHESGREGLLEYMEKKLISIGGL
ncbi:MAG TPA: NAD-dependent succinate-semialdehyde dehydrogenase [Chitinophagales bacterium]|nr:NAD-dependent succinate-semialdehyde dehydrogenase [Chitinophagales bacterium]HNM30828.1 NAD-dependent succinate-semialdehyde dehydrogenase [Chitinophagales bacterium]HNO28012.1 NAD-dependent succinate-semialdehyde dehydrogenase [Chitinophagales bacterium]